MGLGRNSPRLAQLKGHGVHYPFVVPLEIRSLSPADGVDHRIADAVLAGKAGVRPPFVLSLPVATDGDDGKLEEAALNRALEAQGTAELRQQCSQLGRVDEGVEGPSETAIFAQYPVPAGANEGIPDRLTGGVQLVTGSGWEAAHVVTLTATVLASLYRSSRTFGDYGKRWLASRPDLRPSSAERYERLWRLWLEPDFGTVPLGKMTPEDWRTWFTSRRSGHPGSTQPGAAYRLARAILNTAVDDGLIRANPCRVKGAGREQSPERPIAMPDQVDRIPEVIDPRYKAMVLLAAYGSLRFGELAGLRRHRIDLLHRTIRVEENAVELSSRRTVFGPPKTGAGRRTVSIPENLVTILDDQPAEYVGPDLDALVFTSPEGRESVKVQASVSTQCEAAWRDEAGVGAEAPQCATTATLN